MRTRGARTTAGYPRPYLRTLWLLLLLLAPGWLASPLQAHPHAWIDLDIVLEADPEDRIVAIHQTWIIDPLYSRYLHDDAMEQFEGDTPEAKLAALGAEILDNLAEYDWYTEFTADGRRIRGRPDGGAQLYLEDKRIRFRFRLVLDEPADPRSEDIEYRIYDPTYFIEVLHDADSTPRLELHSSSCRLDIVKPRPDPAIVARALALDFNQTGEADLGRHFAERVLVRCD